LGKVQQYGDLLVGLGLLGHCCRQCIQIEPAGLIEQGILADARPPAHAHNHVVIAPHHIRQQNDIACIEPHLGKDADGMGDAAGDHRQADGLAFQGGIFGEQVCLPALAQLRQAEGGGISKRLTGTNPLQAVHDARKTHGVTVFLGDADGAIDAVGFFLGLGALAQYSLGEEKLLPHLGKHGHELVVPLEDLLVEFHGKRVHRIVLPMSLI
jgi:hypothetical protein